MGYLQELHEAHKARLRRLAVGAPAGSGPAKAGMASMADGPAAAGKSDSRSERPRIPTIFEIKALVARNYGTSTAALESASRAVRYRIPRMVAIHLARRLTGGTFDEIALRLGDRHHSTALHADRQVLIRRRQDPAFDIELRAIERQLMKR